MNHSFVSTKISICTIFLDEPDLFGGILNCVQIHFLSERPTRFYTICGIPPFILPHNDAQAAALRSMQPKSGQPLIQMAVHTW